MYSAGLFRVSLIGLILGVRLTNNNAKTSNQTPCPIGNYRLEERFGILELRVAVSVRKPGKPCRHFTNVASIDLHVESDRGELAIDVLTAW